MAIVSASPGIGGLTAARLEFSTAIHRTRDATPPAIRGPSLDVSIGLPGGFGRWYRGGDWVDRAMWVVVVNRIALRQLAEDRVLDARALLDAPGLGRWSGAYYLSGYAVECGLKACVMAFVERTGQIFIDKNFSQKCFTHNLGDLVEVAGLNDEHINQLKSNSAFAEFWKTTLRWSEAARYQQRTEVEARDLHEAITNDPDGVLPWIRSNW